MARARDYRREYQRRKEQATERGLTTAQARGHARTVKGESKVSELRAQGVIGAPRRTTQSLVTADGTFHRAVELDTRNSRKVATWNSALGKLMDGRVSRLNKIAAQKELASFKGKTITDTRGNKYTLATDLNTIQQALAEGSEEGGFTFIKHYKITGGGIAA